MGWTFQHINGKIDRKSICRAEVSDRFEVVKDTMVGTTWYAAIRNKKTGEVFADIVLTKIDRYGYCNFGMKWLSEKDGPLHDDCPESILSLLSPTDSEYAKDWREKCRQKRRERSMDNSDKSIMAKAPYGTRLVVELIGGDQRTVIKMAPAYQFKTWWLMVENGCHYVPKTRVKTAKIA